MKSLISKYLDMTDKEQMYLDIAIYMSIVVGIIILWSAS